MAARGRIVSPSSAIYDRDHKRRAYLALGVREYWVVDPRTRAIEVWQPGDASPRVQRERCAYRTPDGQHTVAVDIPALFRGTLAADEDYC